MQNLTLTARQNSVFRLALDFTEIAAIYDLPNCIIRMQMRQGPFTPLIYEWSTTNGKVVYNSTTKTAVFTAPVADVLNFSGKYKADIIIELANGAPDVEATADITFLKGVTRTAAYSSETDTDGVINTVEVEGSLESRTIILSPMPVLKDSAVKDKDLSSPPPSPSMGDRYIVGPSPTGAWSGRANDVAAWDGTAWTFISPAGATLVLDEMQIYGWSATAAAWQAITSAPLARATKADLDVVTSAPANIEARVYNDVIAHTVSRARASNVATLVLDAAHGLGVGVGVNVRGLGGAGYNGRITTVSGTTGSTLKYASTGADESTAADTGGQVDRNGVYSSNGAGAWDWVGDPANDPNIATSIAAIADDLAMETTNRIAGDAALQAQVTTLQGQVVQMEADLILVTLPASPIAYWEMNKYTASPRPRVPNIASIPASQPLSLVGPGRRQFGNTNFWVPSGLTLISGRTAPDGSSDATRVTNAGSSWYLAPARLIGASSYLAPGTYTIALSIKWNGSGSANFRLGDLHTASYLSAAGTGSWQRFSHTFVAADALSFPVFYTPDATSAADFDICDYEIFAGSVDHGPEPIDSSIYFQPRVNATVAPAPVSGVIDFGSANFNAYTRFQAGKNLAHFTVICLYDQKSAGFNAAFQSFIADNIAGYTAFGAGLALFSKGVELSGSLLSSRESNYFGSLDRGYSTLAYTFDGTNLLTYVDGVLFDTLINARSGLTTSDFDIGLIASQFYAGIKMGALGLWNRAISASEVAQAHDAIKARGARAGIALEPLRVMIFEGDSITVGHTATANNGYAALAAAQAVPIIRASNDLALSGSTIGGLVSRKASLIAHVPTDKKGVKYGAHIFVGANDLGHGPSSTSDFLISYGTYLDDLRASGKFDFIIAATVISSTLQGDGGVQFDADRATVNAQLAAWVGTKLDALVDFAANASVGANGAANNTTYFSDKVHPTNAGHAIMGSIAAAVISALPWGY